MGILGRRSLRSTERGFLIVPFARPTTKQNRVFSVVGPSFWNGGLSLALRFYPRILSNSCYAHLKAFLSRSGIGSTYEQGRPDMHCVMHKCIMVKVGGKRNTRKVFKKHVNLMKSEGNLQK